MKYEKMREEDADNGRLAKAELTHEPSPLTKQEKANMHHLPLQQTV